MINLLERYFLAIFNDRVFFIFLQTILTTSFLYGLFHDFFHRNSGAVIIRGQESKGVFLKIFDAVALVIVTQIIMSADFLNGYKVATIFFDLIQVGYLCLFNGWFRNKLMGYYVKFQNSKEKL